MFKMSIIFLLFFKMFAQTKKPYIKWNTNEYFVTTDANFMEMKIIVWKRYFLDTFTSRSLFLLPKTI